MLFSDIIFIEKYGGECIMQEAEVSLRIAITHIITGKTNKDIYVSIDGAHIKTQNKIHFDIWNFMKCNYWYKDDGITERWQGEWSCEGYNQRIIISSKPGIGDVVIEQCDGKRLFIESKKDGSGRGQEYSLIREAIGQLMTGCEIDENTIPIVAVPYTNKSYELAKRWSAMQQIKIVGIKFYLVTVYGEIVIV